MLPLVYQRTYIDEMSDQSNPYTEIWLFVICILLWLWRGEVVPQVKIVGNIQQHPNLILVSFETCGR